MYYVLINIAGKINMARTITSLKDQLAKLEEKTKALIKEREQEIINIFKAHSSITIDDQLLAGFLIFANNKDNHSHPILKEFEGLSYKLYPPKKTRQKRKDNRNRVDNN